MGYLPVNTILTLVGTLPQWRQKTYIVQVAPGISSLPSETGLHISRAREKTITLLTSRHVYLDTHMNPFNYCGMKL
jgi:hypothetical protein